MGKIFGISDLPVSTIMTPFEPIIIEAPKVGKVVERVIDGKVDNKFIAKQKKFISNPILRMRYGIGRLMKHFSKSNKIN